MTPFLPLLPSLLPSLLLQLLCRRSAAVRPGWRGWLLGLLLGLAGAGAQALPALVLDDSQPSAKAWPAITVLHDPGGRLTLDSLHQRLRDFTPPTGAEANLGPQRHPVWLRLPLQVAGGDSRWVLDIDYPALNRIDVYVVQAGRTVAQALLGNAQPFDQRPMRTRPHAMTLVLQPGQAYEVLMRVDTNSTMVLPISLSKAEDFHARESGEQLLQGILTGLALALLTYSLLHWLSLRDPMFLFYALMLAGVGTFLLIYFGIANQYLWNHQTGAVFQLASMAEMVFWTRVLGLRIEGIRRDAERVTLEKQALLSLANTDALTGLPNRRGLQQALDLALRDCRPDNVVAVYLLDLDGFKPVNDRWGHDVGDQLLVQVGQRLRAQLRRSDGVARLGGDEFVIMSAGIGGDAEAMALGRKVLDAFGLPFEVQGQVCKVGLTIGFALAPHDGVLAADLLKRADAAMYAGKQRGRHCIQRGGASLALSGH